MNAKKKRISGAQQRKKRKLRDANKKQYKTYSKLWWEAYVRLFGV